MIIGKGRRTTMNMALLKKTTLGAFVAFMAGTAFAADYYWTSPGEGNWSDLSKWHVGSVAGTASALPSADDIVHVTCDGAVINVEGDCYAAQFELGFATAAAPRTCRLVGTGTLTLGNSTINTSLQMNDYTTLVQDGPDIFCVDSASVQYCEGGTMIVKSGVYTPKIHYLKKAGARFVVDGGTVTSAGSTSRVIDLRNGWSTSTSEPPIAFIDLKSGVLEAKVTFRTGTFTMTGGVWDRTAVGQTDLATLATYENLAISISGGEVRLASTDCTPFPQVPTLFNAENLSGTRNYGDFSLRNTPGEFAFENYLLPESKLLVPCDTIFRGNTLSVVNWAIAEGVHDVTMDVDTLRLNTGGNFVVGTSNSSYLPLHIHSPRLITFESTKANSKAVFLSGLQMHNTDAHWRMSKGAVFRTTALEDGTSPATFNFCSPLFDEGATIDVTGVGRAELIFSSFSNVTSNARAAMSGLSNRLARVSVDAGSTLALSGWAWLNRDYALRTDRFTLGAGAKLVTLAATYGQFEALEAELDPSAELLIDTPDLANSDFSPSPLALGPKHLNDFATPETRPALTLTAANAASEWNAEWINGMPVVWRKNKDVRATCSMSRVNMSKWRGTEDSSWANEANWLVDAGKALADDPLEQSRVFDGGFVNTRVNVAAAEKAYQVRVYNKTAPVAFVGTGSLEFGANALPAIVATAWDVDNAVVNSSDYPVIFDVPVSISSAIAGNRYFTVNNSGRSYVAFMKSVDAGDALALRGEMMVGGALTAKGFTAYNRGSTYPARDTRLAVLPGGSVTLTAQTWLQSGPNCVIDVYSNAAFTVMNGDARYNWGTSDARAPIHVYEGGLFDCRCPLGGTGAVSFRGAGEVRLLDTGSLATADYTVTFDGVTFAVETFASGHPIVLKGSPTWGAQNDWTYDLAPVTLPAGETLTVNTGDVDDPAVGHVATIAAALTAEGLVKDGAGTLVLGSRENVLGAVKVKAGTLAWTAPLAVDSLELAPGAVLSPGAAAPLTVAGNVDLAGGAIVLSADARAAVGSAWTTLVSVSEGAALVPPTLPENSPYRLRVVDSGAGLALQMRLAPGFAISIR